MMLHKADYEAMTNKELLNYAKKKGIIVSPAEHNRLTVVRMVTDDRRGLADRQEFIQRLRAFDNQHIAHRSEVVAVVSFLVSLLSLYLAYKALR
jgi:hypothetical protein